jgi:hypothetical protein
MLLINLPDSHMVSLLAGTRETGKHVSTEGLQRGSRQSTVPLPISNPGAYTTPTYPQGINYVVVLLGPAWLPR